MDAQWFMPELVGMFGDGYCANVITKLPIKSILFKTLVPAQLFEYRIVSISKSMAVATDLPCKEG